MLFMIVDIMSRKQIQEYIIKEVKRIFEYNNSEMENLRRRILKLEETNKARK